jgi:hypothetical protein
VARTFYTNEFELLAHPAGGIVGPDEWVDTFLTASYHQFTWPYFGQLLSDWVHRNAGRQTSWSRPTREPTVRATDNEFAVYLGVECTDAQWPTNWSVWSRENWAIFRVAPFATWDNAWFNAACIYWPAPASNPVPINEAACRARC